MRDRSVRLFWTFILSVAAVNVAVFWGYIVDDAYISFRYLNNLLEGNGLVFNPGERLESFSNFIWIAILIPFSLAGVPLILSSRIAGALFFLGTILLGKKIIDQLDPQAARDNNLFLAFLIASCPHLGFWATGGLETVAFSFFICSSIHLALRDSFALSDRILLPLSCFFLTLCRPEGAALAVLCYGYKSWQQGRSRAILGSVVLLLVLVLAMLGLRYVYYGEFLPHTFFSKSRTTLESLPGYFLYSFGALSSIGGVAALLVPIVVLYKFRKREIWFLFSSRVMSSVLL